MSYRFSRFGVVAGFVAAAVLLGACTTEPEPESPSSSPTYVSYYVAPEPPSYAPFTGVLIEGSASLTRPSFAAKIDNHPSARPQVGLEQTDLLYEELVEGGLTRYVAVWHSRLPEEIGPIRSIRPMDPDIIAPHAGIVAYSGGQQRFVELMEQTEVYNAIHGQRDTDAFMYRTREKRAPHDVIVRALELVESHADLAPPVQLYSYAENVSGASATRDGAEVAGVDLVFGAETHPSWRWDENAGRFLRSQEGVADLDSAGEQLAAVNVVVVRVGVSDDQGVPKTELSGSGDALVFSGGRFIEATWAKPEQSAAIRLLDANGGVVRLAPGNTWFELVPLSGSAEVVPAG